MLKQFKKRLLLIYMLTTGLLLAVILIFLFLLNIKQFSENNINNFENLVRRIKEEVTESISYSWLSKMEADNHLIISVSSNSIPIGFAGSWYPPTERKILMDKLKSFPSSDFFLPDGLSTNMESSPVYSFYGNEGEHYYGCSYLTIGYHNRKEIVIIQQVLNEKDYMVTQLFFFALICVASIIAVYFISRIIVSKSLHPLKEGLRRQNEFIAAASHELRSPLTVIMAGISTLKLKNAVKEEIIPCIDREGERMAKLIHDMLLIASSDAKTWTLNLEEIEMDTFFIHLYDSLTQFCRKKRQKLTLELPEKELPLFVGDRMRLEQILVILFDNACSYSPENSIITIQVSEHKKCLRIEVMDHGCGIPTEDKNRIFDRFYRSDRSRNDKNHFGLGLSIAAELVTMHRGKITVRDTNGGGTTFVVELPVVKQ